MLIFFFWELALFRRQHWDAPQGDDDGIGGLPIHISGMGLSYILMLIAFYMDNGKELPVWKDLPSVTYWLVPGGVGVPLIVRALLRYRTRFGAGNRD
jgi:hypothetical protein